MKKIKLDEYKEDSIYFYLFDKLIKDKYQNKDEYLNSIDISPSTYRRARLNASNISNELLIKLCSEFNLNNINKSDIDELEEYINKLYNNIYYKLDIDFDKELEFIQNKIKLNQIIYPVYNLIELLINSSKGIQTSKFNENFYKYYIELRKYKKIFNDDLNNIYELIELIFTDRIQGKIEYTNVICYQILAARTYEHKRYVESLYFCNIAKEELIRTLNFNRLYSINSTIISNYISLHKYNDAYELAYNQLNSIKANIKLNYLYDFTISNYLLVCFITQRYQEIIKKIHNIINLNKTIFTILVLTSKILNIDIDLSKFSYNKDLYNELIKLKINKKTNYEFLEKYSINNNLLNYLKKL
ncbi:MAG: hypothetical protein R3Y60_01070 [bacterium]